MLSPGWRRCSAATRAPRSFETALAMNERLGVRPQLAAELGMG